MKNLRRSLGVVTLSVLLLALSGSQSQLHQNLRIVSPAVHAPASGFGLVVSLRANAWSEIQKVLDAHELTLESSIPALDAVVARGEGNATRALVALRADPRVRNASLDLTFEVAGACCRTPKGEVDALWFADAEARRVKAFGPLLELRSTRRPRVAVLDTGVDRTHPDLASVVTWGSSLVPDAPWDRDASGHGTAMSSLVAAKAPAADAGVTGVADAELLAIRVADDRGRARLAQVAAGITLAVDRGADVILLSLGARRPTPVLIEALTYAETRGAVVVAAAGNRNTNVDLWPAADPRVLSVACSDDDGRLAYSTTLAPTTDLLAPSVEVLAAMPRGGYAHVTGSSAAAARVAGVVARIRAQRPDLTPAQVRALLRGSRTTPPLFASQPELARAFPVGSVDAAAIAAQLSAPCAKLKLEHPRAFPVRARVGEPIVYAAQLRNAGLKRTAAGPVEVRLGDVTLTLDAPALEPGQTLAVQLPTTMPTTATARLSIRLAPGVAQASCGIDRCARGNVRDLAIANLRATAQEDGGLTVAVAIEGRGQSAEAGAIELRIGERTVATTRFTPLTLGASQTLRLNVPATAFNPTQGTLQLQARFANREADDAPENDQAWLDVDPPAAPDGVKTQYQQSGKLNVILDSPWRLAPGRDQLPLLVYVPEKGDQENNTFVRVERTEIRVREQAATTTPGTLVYRDVNGGSTTAPAGLEILDAMGQVKRDARLFGHMDLYVPGHYEIVQVPRSALIPPSAGDAERFLEVEVDWTHRRRFLYLFRQTRSGTTKKVLRVKLASHARPSLQSGGRYYDAHVHTVAEWYQDDSFSLLAPRKAWGGPLPMLDHAAYALGLIDSPGDAKHHVITTDHNEFYRPGDGIKHRPSFGPSSVGASGKRSEWERMGELYGMARGEEVTFHSSNPFVGPLNLPTGAHLLSYRAQHIDGPWHGGSNFARTFGSNDADVKLVDVLTTLAKTNPTENARAAVFAAHPFDGYADWTNEHLDAAFEPDPAKRTDAVVLASNDGFVTKGLQLWNGDFGRHVLPKSAIEWDDLNPWANTAFAQGDADWDRHLNRGLGRWHGLLAKVMAYELKAEPGIRFPRKIFASAGTDAHGDFNVTEDRLATIVGLKSTFLVDGNAFGGTLTYALSDLQEGADASTRAFEALMAGSSVLTDGPLVEFSLDAEARFDGDSLTWDENGIGTDADGRIGGGGRFDGRGTALVPRGSEQVRLRYRYTSTPEWGDVTHVALYRTSPNDPNPVTLKPSGEPLFEPRGWLAPLGADQDHTEALEPTEEGLITATSALQVGAFTGDPSSIAAEGRRALTNPVWAVPYDVTVDIDRTETDANGRTVIPPGALTVTFRFDASLQARPYVVELKALDANGRSSDKATGPIDVLTAVGPNDGWSDVGPIKNSALALTNQRALPLDLDRFPSGSDQVTFVAYFHDALRDAWGNPLHRIAHAFRVQGQGTGGGTGPALARSTATTAPAATATPTAGGGRSGGGGCALVPTPSTDQGGLPLLAFLLLVSGLGLLRRRVTR